MDERDERRGRHDNPEAGDAAADAQRPFPWSALAPAEDEATGRRSAGFQRMARELGAIVRGYFPDDL